jgi:hypothetical protein
MYQRLQVHYGNIFRLGWRDGAGLLAHFPCRRIVFLGCRFRLLHILYESISTSLLKEKRVNREEYLDDINKALKARCAWESCRCDGQ